MGQGRNRGSERKNTYRRRPAVVLKSREGWVGKTGEGGIPLAFSSGAEVPAKRARKVEGGNTAGVYHDWKPVLATEQERGSAAWHSQGRSFQVLFALMNSAAGSRVNGVVCSSGGRE